MTTIEDLIRIEYESMQVAIFPWERREHAARIVKLEKVLENQQRGWEVDESNGINNDENSSS